MTDWNKIEEIAVNSTTGEKGPACGHQAVAATDNAIVTETALRVMRSGGNAADAAVAACLVQSAIEQFVTNHTGLITCLYYDAKSGTTVQLDAKGTMPARLPMHQPTPTALGGYEGVPFAASCIPGQMKGLAALHERFGSKPWGELCDDAVYWTDRGHRCTKVESHFLNMQASVFGFHPESRAHFFPDGRLPDVGDRVYSADLARTMRRLQEEGPGYFTQGEWAEKFVATGNDLGWAITMDDMVEVPALWTEPLAWRHQGTDILSLAPPEKLGAVSCMTIGILRHLGTREKGHFSVTPEAMFDVALALTMALRDANTVDDPQIVNPPLDVLLDDTYHAQQARIVDSLRPKQDLRNHVMMTAGPIMARLGHAPPNMPRKNFMGSCENSFMDAQGNVCQLMNTYQSGGISGMVVDGVSMMGSHIAPGMGRLGFGGSSGSGYYAPGARLSGPLGNTIILRHGKPAIALGTTGNVPFATPQMLHNLLDFGLDAKTATELPRINAMAEDRSIISEGHLDSHMAEGLAKLGVRLMQTGPWQPLTGSFSISERDASSGLLNAYADPRIGGVADGIAP